MAAPNAKPDPDAPANVARDFWHTLRLPHFRHEHPPVRNANEVNENQLSPIDKLAIAITDKVGSFGFFAIIFIWTVCWTGYNILATEVKGLHWTPFDPFPSFVAYLLISNVIQILLMPLIMVGQNLQGRHTEIRAELDFETNLKAEKEVELLLRHIEYNTELTIHLMRHLDCKLSEEELHNIQAHQELTNKIVADKSVPGAADPTMINAAAEASTGAS